MKDKNKQQLYIYVYNACFIIFIIASNNDNPAISNDCVFNANKGHLSVTPLLFNLAYQHQPYNTNYPVYGSLDPIKTNLYQLSLAPVWNVSNQLHIGLDLGMITNVVVADDQKFNYFVMGAMTHQPVEDLDLGISYLRVAPNFTDEFSAGYSSIFKLGVTYRF